MPRGIPKDPNSGRWKVSTPSAADKGSAEQAALLAGQLRRLRSWEDPANNMDATAVVYREMVAAAHAQALAGGGVALDNSLIAKRARAAGEAK